MSYRLQLFLVLDREGAGLHGDDWRGRLGIVRNWRAAFGAEDAPYSLARAAGTSPLLDGAVDGHLVLGDDSHKGCKPISREAVGLRTIAGLQ
jgi:hypothetical protein